MYILYTKLLHFQPFTNSHFLFLTCGIENALSGTPKGNVEEEEDQGDWRRTVEVEVEIVGRSGKEVKATAGKCKPLLVDKCVISNKTWDFYTHKKKVPAIPKL